MNNQLCDRPKLQRRAYTFPSEDTKNLDLALKCLYGFSRSLVRQEAETLRTAIRRACRSENPYADVNDLDDVCQEVFVKIWKGRSGFTYQGTATWRSYVRRCAATTWCEWFRKHQVEEDLEDEYASVDVRQDLRGQIEKALGEALFGYDEAVSLKEREQRVRAVRRFYIDELSFDRVKDEASIGRATLDAWLADPAVLADFAYRELYVPGEQLVRHLLDLRSNRPLAELAMMKRESCPLEVEVSGWGRSELQFFIWRYGFGHSSNRVKRDTDMTGERLSLLHNYAIQRWPYCEYIETLKDRLGSHSTVLTRSGIWKRLALEYWYQDELELGDIVERLSPPAALVGFHLTAGMLNVWLSGGRVVRLARNYLDS